MQSILTLTIGEFELVHDLLSILIAAMGASAIFFLLSQKQVAQKFQPLLLLAGIVAAVGCYHSVKLFQSWNEAFELAGNSYAASGHFFHELYRYSDWILTMPLLLVELVFISGVDQKGKGGLLKHLISATMGMVFFAYLGASNLGGESLLVRWSYWVLELLSFLYIAWILVRHLSHQSSETASNTRLFLKARNLFLVSWAFYPLATLFSLSSHGFSEHSLIVFLGVAAVADFLSKCGVSFYIYRAALL